MKFNIGDIVRRTYYDEEGEEETDEVIIGIKRDIDHKHIKTIRFYETSVDRFDPSDEDIKVKKIGAVGNVKLFKNKERDTTDYGDQGGSWI